MKTDTKIPGVYVDRDTHTRTCLAFELAGINVGYVSIADLESRATPQPLFSKAWLYTPEYPVQRYVDLLLALPAAGSMLPKDRERLRKIGASAPSYQPFQTQAEKRKPEMKSQAISAAAAKLSGKPGAAAAPKAAAKAPAKSAAKAAPAKTPAPKAAAKAVPAKQPAVKAASNKPAAAKGTAGDVAHKVADDSKVKRGFLREYVDKAKATKGFTRDSMTAAFKGKETEERLVRYFYYCTSEGIFAPAK